MVVVNLVFEVRLWFKWSIGRFLYRLNQRGGGGVGVVVVVVVTVELR
jgi:hypothetical protein